MSEARDALKEAEAEALAALQNRPEEFPMEGAEEEPGAEQAAATPESAAPEATPPSPEAEAEGEDEDFIPRADLESLLEGLEGDARERVITAYKSFQRSATKRNQEVSKLLRDFDGVDPSQAKEAYDFVESLKTDRDFATQVHQELASALELEGATPAQAQAQATQAVQDIQAGDLSEWGIDPDNPLVAELREMRAFREEMRQARESDQTERQRELLIREVERQDAELRRQHPEYEEPQLEAIYRLAAAYGGDLFQAAEYFEDLQAGWQTDYVAKKTKVPEGVGPVPAGAAHSEEPVEINNVKDAHKEALRRLQEGYYDRS